MHPIEAINTLWAFWVLSWVLASAWSARTAARPGGFRGLPYYVFTLAGAAMLFGVQPPWQGIAPIDGPLGWLLVAVAVTGFLFSWWARLHLGTLWSGTVTRKEGHHIIDTGPYRLVRHPIYTGIILASFATAFAKATPIALAGAATMTLGWYLKARLEERFLREELGRDAYCAYAARVPMLVPFVKA
jgi:protein-S-isoprenylcysteine O-methyltransferase Ste14